jgi:hypothetical protein
MDSYVECLVKAKPQTMWKFLKILLIMLTAVFLFLTLMTGLLMFILAIVSGVGVYFANMKANVEYEYLYLDRELTIDKIMAQTKRKRVAVYKVDRMEIFAPIKSYHLDNFKNRQVKEKDYSIGEELKPDRRYVFYYEGGEKVIVSPSEEMVKAMKMVAPRKVFND